MVPGTSVSSKLKDAGNSSFLKHLEYASPQVVGLEIWPPQILICLT